MVTVDEYRVESDTMGEVKVPNAAYYGAQTQRAVENFPISGIRLPKDFIRAMALIKLAAAKANMQLGLLEPKKGEAIVSAAKEVMEGSLYEQFVVDVFQTGSGTSTNMNANEVIANRAIELLGGQRGDRKLIPALQSLAKALEKKTIEFDDMVKAGRTHLQDAVPVTLGQEFSGYASMIRHGIRRAKMAQDTLLELPLGGTATGTGLNAHPKYAELAITEGNRLTAFTFKN